MENILRKRLEKTKKTIAKMTEAITTADDEITSLQERVKELEKNAKDDAETIREQREENEKLNDQVISHENRPEADDVRELAAELFRLNGGKPMTHLRVGPVCQDAVNAAYFAHTPTVAPMLPWQTPGCKTHPKTPCNCYLLWAKPVRNPRMKRRRRPR